MEHHTTFWGDGQGRRMSPKELVQVLNVVSDKIQAWDWQDESLRLGGENKVDALIILWIRVSAGMENAEWPSRPWKEYDVRVRRACERFNRYMRCSMTGPRTISKITERYLTESKLCSILSDWNLARVKWEARVNKHLSTNNIPHDVLLEANKLPDTTKLTVTLPDNN